MRILKILLPALFILFLCASSDKDKNEYGLKVITEYKDYKKSVRKNANNELVDLESFIPGIQLDIRYATKNNFTKKKIYNLPKAFVRKPVAEALNNIHKELFKLGYGLKIFDAYRPYSATLKFYELYPDTNFVAAPWKGSVHNRGCAVDVSLIDIKMEDDFEMPTDFDDFSEKASHSYKKLPAKQINNRKYLLAIMTKYGFEKYEAEWWHYSYKGWDKYDIMDISFEQLMPESK